MKTFHLLFLLLLVNCVFLKAQPSSSQEMIRLNQIGFYTKASKIAVIEGNGFSDFYILKVDKMTKVFRGKLTAMRQSPFSARQTQIAEFTDFKEPGTYTLVVDGLGPSHEFEITDQVHAEVLKASLKGFYYQRFSTSLPIEFAGKWSRPFSHPDDSVVVHASAATTERPEGTVIKSPKGWIDAGDYNKYIVNSGITMGTLLSAFEDFPQYYKNLKVNIPESKNDVPDILDEVLWNLRWMLSMQDPFDGGIYHKCTNAEFDEMIMPHEATTKRYVVQKGTAAALNFAAVTAQAARIFKGYKKEFPGLADSCLSASEWAWTWAKQNPNVQYNQEEINKAFEPDITTGPYGDKVFEDEFFWAACELAVTTGKAEYLNGSRLSNTGAINIPAWNQVRLLGYYTLIRNQSMLPVAFHKIISEIKQRIVNHADTLIDKALPSYNVSVMGLTKEDFIWGSNSVAGNQGVFLIQAFQITHNSKYLKYALYNLDYLLGRNATGFSFLTGFGDKTPMHIHHRPSEADGIVDPVPGLLAGGPNPGMQDKCTYPSSVPDEAYADHVCSYASNEIAINWNAPFVYLTGAIEALSTTRGLN